MNTIRATLAFLTVLCVTLAIVRLRADGVLLLGTVFFIAWMVVEWADAPRDPHPVSGDWDRRDGVSD